MKWHYYLAWIGIRNALNFFKMGKISGWENIPTAGGVIIASNHISYFDPPILGSCTPREVHYLAKWELFKFKPFGSFLRSVNAIPIKRNVIDRQALIESLEILKQGQALLVFPEGTRNLRAKLLPPKFGVGKLALEAGVPIVPAHIANSQKPTRAFLSGKPIEVKFGPPIPKTWLEQVPKDKEGYRLVVAEIMQRIKKLESY